MSDIPTGAPQPSQQRSSSPETPAGTDLQDDLAEVRSADRRAAEFVAALPAASDRAGRTTAYARTGLAIMVVGLVATIIGLILSQMSDNPLDQSTQISLGVAGLAATCFGAAIFLRYSIGDLLRYWLLRILHEQHRQGRDPNQP